MPTSIDEPSQNALEVSGVHRRYWDMTLNDHQQAVEFLDGGLMTEVLQREKGLCIVGLDDAREVTVLMARWLVLSDWSVKVVTLSQMARLLRTDFEDDDPDRDYMQTADVLVVLDFQSNLDCPLKSRERAEVTDFVREFLDQKKVVILHLQNQDMVKWWTSTFIHFVRDKFKALHISKAKGKTANG